MEVPRWQNRYIGIPFLEASRNIENGGLDCWGYARYILHNEAAIDLPLLEEVFYSEGRKNRKGLAEFIKNYDAISIGWSQVNGIYQPFDLLVVNVGGPFHVAVVSEKGWMLHVESGCDSVEERYTGMRWKGRISSAWRHVSRM